MCRLASAALSARPWRPGTRPFSPCLGRSPGFSITDSIGSSGVVHSAPQGGYVELVNGWFNQSIDSSNSQETGFLDKRLFSEKVAERGETRGLKGTVWDSGTPLARTHCPLRRPGHDGYSGTLEGLLWRRETEGDLPRPHAATADTEQKRRDVGRKIKTQTEQWGVRRGKSSTFVPGFGD